MVKIEELNFSARVYNCLRRAGIETVEQLKRMSDEDLVCLRNFGTTCLAEVRRKIAQPAMTNGERVRAMTDEELADFIMLSPEMEFGVCEHCQAFRGHGAYTPCGTENGWCTAELRCDAFKKWLQQPADGCYEEKSQH